MQSLPNQYLQTAIAAADAARQVTGKYFRTRLSIDSKPDRSPVTVADRMTENLMRQIILGNHPEHGFWGEESGAQAGNHEWLWIIDPIDGTKSFATGKPTFGTLISLLYEHTPMLGIIDHPQLNERWIGIRGKTTTLNSIPCQTNPTSLIATATIYATTLDMFDKQSLAQYSALSKQCRFRVFGGDCYCYGLLASGYTELVCEADLKPYDYMALIPVVEGAGGIISDWHGNPLSVTAGDQVLASANTTLHQQAIKLLNA